MAKKITFYFDIMSPYCYFANTKLPDLARKHECELVYHPMDIPSAKVAAGNYGPSNVQVPSKIKALMADFQRWSKRYDIPFTLPKGFDARNWNIASLYAIKNGNAESFINAAYNKVWADGIDPSDCSELKLTLSMAGFDANAAMAYINSPKGECEFKKSCIDAHNAEVFGAPIMTVDDQLFWGNDRLDFLDEYLSESVN